MSSRVITNSQEASNIVGVHYKVLERSGEGSFGIIFEGVDQVDGRRVAIKFEPRKSEAPQLRDEYRSYNILDGCFGIPRVYYYGQEGLHNILVLDLLGPSLEDLFDTCNRKFDNGTVAALAEQMITRIQTVHEKNLIYRDIKPDNFLVHLDFWNVHDIFIVDFGMAKPYRDGRTGAHIPYRERKSLSGTARYMSINTHLGREQSRRDDLEALGYVFMYFLRGSLPWQGLQAPTNKLKYAMIATSKQGTLLEDLCDKYPSEFHDYLKNVRSLGFTDDPDYDYLRGLMRKVLEREKSKMKFQWLTTPSVQDKYSKEKFNTNPTVATTGRQAGAKPTYHSNGSGKPHYSGFSPGTQTGGMQSMVPQVPKTMAGGTEPTGAAPPEQRTFFQRVKNFFLCTGCC